MSKVKFLSGNKINLPTNATEEGILYFTEDTGELFSSPVKNQPLVKVGDVYSEYINLADLKIKNPAIKGKLYLTNDNEVYAYSNNDYVQISGSGTTTVINASNVIENPQRVFVTSQEKAQISANDLENSSQTQRISNIENTLNTLSTTDEKVSMDATSQSKYLSELVDGLTVVNNNGKLEVQGIKNLLSTVNEINLLQGASSNIQQQINNLSGVSSFRGVFSSLADLQLAPSPQNGQYAIVSETNSSDYYFYYNGSWEFSHNTTGTVDIDINAGTIGVLEKGRYMHQNASETAFTDPTGKILAIDTNSAIVEVFRFADSLLKGLTQTVGSPLSQTDTIDVNLRNFKTWYANVAEAITVKGINASPSNNGDEIVQKIKSIPNISVNGILKKKSKINVTSGSTIEVQLSSALPTSDITTTLIEFVGGSVGIIHYELTFDNSNSDNFIPNDCVEFDGKMKLKQEYKYTLDTLEQSVNGTIQAFTLNASKLDEIKDIYL